mmetsp:Transcript_22955/g.65038  ORF Transcript_22955/g.65038 Transcript_22955/m.65038 type:complete len:213 (+) Transcript_22955:290-928(+)
MGVPQGNQRAAALAVASDPRRHHLRRSAQADRAAPWRVPAGCAVQGRPGHAPPALVLPQRGELGDHRGNHHRLPRSVLREGPQGTHPHVLRGERHWVIRAERLVPVPARRFRAEVVVQVRHQRARDHDRRCSERRNAEGPRGIPHHPGIQGRTAAGRPPADPDAAEEGVAQATRRVQARQQRDAGGNRIPARAACRCGSRKRRPQNHGRSSH